MSTTTQKELPSYTTHIKQFSENLLGRLRTYDQLESRGDIPPGHADKLIAQTIEAQIYTVAKVMAKEIADQRNRQ